MRWFEYKPKSRDELKLKRITIRVMWNNPDEKEEAIKIANQIVRMLIQSGMYAVKSSPPLRNRENEGGRIYINVSFV